VFNRKESRELLMKLTLPLKLLPELDLKIIKQDCLSCGTGLISFQLSSVALHRASIPSS
jgi:hypothetical protein